MLLLLLLLLIVGPTQVPTLCQLGGSGPGHWDTQTIETMDASDNGCKHRPHPQQATPSNNIIIQVFTCERTNLIVYTCNYTL